MRRIGVIVFVAAAGLIVQGFVAQALINPGFTPPMLVQQSQVIAVLKFAKPDGKGKVTAAVEKVIKDPKSEFKDKSIVLDLTAREEATAYVEKRIVENLDGPAILFFGTYQEEGAAGEPLVRGFLHFAGKWLEVEKGTGATWDLVSAEAKLSNSAVGGMEATWAGGTDMLLREVDYILTDPQPECPVAAGVSLEEPLKLSAVPGKVGRPLPVDLAGDGKLALFIPSDAGDRLYVYDAKAKALKDVTADRALKSKSKTAVWGDFNADGKVDLASWDGAALTLHFQGTDGKFTAQPVTTGDALKDGCFSLSVLDVGQKERPGLLASTLPAPVLLVPGKDGTLEPKPLTAKPLPVKDLGQVGLCLAADLDGDNLADVLQIFDQGSVFYQGKGGGTFADPARWPVAFRYPPSANAGPPAKGPTDACLGDYDQDGRLDVFTVSPDGCRLFHNYGPGKMVDMIGLSGEIAYIAQPDGILCQTCDINNDGRQDIFIAYANKVTQFFFNRGFRSTGHAHNDLAFDESHALEAALQGQQSALVADLNGDGAQDLVLVLLNGDLYYVQHVVNADFALNMRAVLPLKGAFAGPLTVVGWAEKRCLGAQNVVAGSQEAFFGRAEPGALEIRWQFPGAQPQKKQAVLEFQPVRVVLEPGK
jgi:hypothetical protein